jgi:hypothetical protein
MHIVRSGVPPFTGEPPCRQRRRLNDPLRLLSKKVFIRPLEHWFRGLEGNHAANGQQEHERLE